MKKTVPLGVITHAQNFRSAKTTDKRILLFTNEDDPFGNMKGLTKADMTRTTLQRAKVKLQLYLHVGFLLIFSFICFTTII